MPSLRLPVSFILLAVVCVAAAGCGDSPSAELLLPVPHIGRGARYMLPPAGRAAARALPVGSLRCTRGSRRTFGSHLEIFARRLDMVIPAGIGVAPPRVRDGAYVKGGRCQYPARTLEPTGLIEVDVGRRVTLGQLFDLWGQPLSRRRLAGFRAARGDRVRAFVNGAQRNGDPRAIVLTRHAAIVLEVGGFFPPSRDYRFPAGL